MRRYFAYGSNMNAEQMLKRCPDSREESLVELKDYEFVIDARGFASIQQKDGRSVWGVVYLVSDEDEISLDRYEGVAKGFYYKMELPSIGCFVYISSSPIGCAPREGYMEKFVPVVAKRFSIAYTDELKAWMR